MQYELQSGAIVTDEDIDYLAEAIAKGNLPGKWTGAVTQGRPRLSNERLVTVPVKFPESVVAQIDKRTSNRSEFIRKAVAAQLHAPDQRVS